MNVAVLVLDSVRKDIFDEYAPRLKELADVDLAECRSVSSWSVPSHASMVTGCLPSDVGIHTYQMSYQHLTSEETIFDVPHRRVGVSSNMYANSYYGFDSFFDSFYNLYATNPEPDGIHMGRWLNDHDGGVIRYLRLLRDIIQHDHPTASLQNALHTKLDDVFERLPLARPIDEGTTAINKKINSETKREPWFVFANYMEAHTPHRPVRQYDSSLYNVPARWSSYDLDTEEIIRRRRADRPLNDNQLEDIRRFRSLYAAAVDYLDREVSSLIEKLRKESDEQTMVIVTADHGENMFLSDDELVWGHSASMSEGLLHVPFLIIGGPEWLQEDPPDFFSHLDLHTLISNVLNDDSQWPVRDRILAELVGGGVSVPDYDKEFFDRSIRAVYDSPSQKWEWDSLGNRNKEEWDDSVNKAFPERIEEMRKREKARENDVKLTEEAESRLEDLGYV